MACEWAARRSGGRALAARLATTVAVCLPYLLWSTARFGTWLPVSARLKSSFPVPDPVASLRVIRSTSLNLVDQASFLVAWLLALGVAVMLARHVVRAWRARTPLEPLTAALGVLALYLIGRFTYMALFSRADVQGSYAVLAHVFNVLVGVRLAAALVSRAGARPRLAHRLTALAAGGLAVLAVLLFAGKVRTTAAAWRESSRLGIVGELELGREIHALTGERDVLYGGTFGILGFFADRAWINLDGVVNTYAYQEVFIAPGSRGQGGLTDYLAANHVSHVVFIVPRGTQLGPEPIRLSAWGILHDRLNEFVVSPEDLLLRRPVARGPAGGGDLYLARYRP
ncbi:MAG TPA: hypothetical protein VJY35_02130, partial [Candidatus Eisenbacteria bacterium]|nr:hypothetical protein [Candidatus Eisenbacteria bacterium]